MPVDSLLVVDVVFEGWVITADLEQRPKIRRRSHTAHLELFRVISLDPPEVRADVSVPGVETRTDIIERVGALYSCCFFLTL